MTTFRTTVELGGTNATGLEVPAEVVESLGTTRKPPVVVTIGGHRYRSTVAVMGGRYLVPLAAEHRNAAGVAAGDEVEVTLELDTEPRVVEVPDDVARALAAEPAAAEFYESMSYSHQRRWMLSITDAKTEATRQRRIAKLLEAMLAKKKQ